MMTARVWMLASARTVHAHFVAEPSGFGFFFFFLIEWMENQIKCSASFFQMFAGLL